MGKGSIAADKEIKPAPLTHFRQSGGQNLPFWMIIIAKNNHTGGRQTVRDLHRIRVNSRVRQVKGWPKWQVNQSFRPVMLICPIELCSDCC